MHHEITRKLWEAFPADKKHDFWAGYLYLKYTSTSSTRRSRERV